MNEPHLTSSVDFRNARRCPSCHPWRCISGLWQKMKQCCYGNSYSNTQLSENQNGRCRSPIERRLTESTMLRLEDRLRNEIQYFFLNPCEKFRAKKRKPFKLTIQIFKIALVTLQLILFGQTNQEMVSFMNDQKSGLKSILLNKETEIFTVQAVYGQINRIRQQVHLLKNESLGVYGFAGWHQQAHENCTEDSSTGDQLCMCISEYSKIQLNPLHSFKFDPASKTSFCMAIMPWSAGESPRSNQSVLLLNGTEYKINFPGLIKSELRFGVRTVLFESPHVHHAADCYNVSVTVTFDNSAHSGKMMIGLNAVFHHSACTSTSTTIFPSVAMVMILLLDCLIIFICFTSIILCSRSLLRAQWLRQLFEKFYKQKHNKVLPWWDKMDFFNAWYLLIIVSDCLTITGSIAKIIIDLKWEGVFNYDMCSLFLGVGCLCVWIGVLRYVGYFHQYNILVLTLKRSLPHVLRFMVCASILYLGFMFCGWVVLGPYHRKFRNPVVTSEALFSLINGDDMYMTFEEMAHSSKLSWAFSQVYLYVFISLFIYIVLSLFIAVITETYETIKEWQEAGFPAQTVLQKFLSEGSNAENNYSPSDTYCCCCCLYHNNNLDLDWVEQNDDDEALLVT